VLAGLTLFALSNHIGIGTLSLTIPLPQSLIDRASILRSSGRMFWPVYYTLIAAGVAVVLRSHRERVAGGLLAAASLVQILDTRAGWKPQHDGYRIQSRSTCRSPLVSPFWAAAGASYHELRRVPLRHHADDYATFAAYAAERGLGTDSAYLARVDPTALQEAAERSEDAITTGNFDPDTLYVLDETHAELAAGTLDRRGDLLARVDGFFVLAPAWQKRKPPAAVTPLALGRRDIIPGIVLGHEVSFGAGGEGERYLRSGWGAPEPWGVWADAADAELSLPIVPGTSNLHVEVEAGALVAPRQSTQQVECQINGSWSTLLEFSVEHNTGWRTLPVPSAALEQSRESETLRVVFHMLNPVSPEALGLNADTRRLGMTLHRAKVSRTD
jgi:hypothetical protein